VPNDREWDESLEAMAAAQIKKLIVVLADSGQVHMSSARRKRTAEVMKTLGCKQVVLTNHSLSRGLITAMAWLGSDVRAFHPRDIAKAKEYLALTAGERAFADEQIVLLGQHLHNLATSATA